MTSIQAWATRSGSLLVTLALAGCASEPVSMREATPVSSERQFAFSEPAKGSAPITLIRDSNFAGGGCTLDVLVNGKRSAALSNAERVTLHLPQGDAIIGVRGTYLCVGSGLAEIEARVNAGQPVTYRVYLDGGGSTRISRTLDR